MVVPRRYVHVARRLFTCLVLGLGLANCQTPGTYSGVNPAAPLAARPTATSSAPSHMDVAWAPPVGSSSGYLVAGQHALADAMFHNTGLARETWQFDFVVLRQLPTRFSTDQAMGLTSFPAAVWSSNLSDSQRLHQLQVPSRSTRKQGLDWNLTAQGGQPVDPGIYYLVVAGRVVPAGFPAQVITVEVEVRSS